MFESSSDLMRRIAGGNLRGEVGHPRYQEGMSERAWFSRVNDLYEPNLCIHFNQVSLSYDSMSDKKGRPLVAVMG
ncbi:S80 family phage morphogenetic serine protease, partial [Enterococcus faecium]|uniref:S80 family phage morphogenetic serine protease n=1 Tax=Enterococcus faecium TaxID=1352 RepID=UPI003F41D950